MEDAMDFSSDDDDALQVLSLPIPPEAGPSLDTPRHGQAAIALSLEMQEAADAAEASAADDDDVANAIMMSLSGEGEGGAAGLEVGVRPVMQMESAHGGAEEVAHPSPGSMSREERVACGLAREILDRAEGSP